MQVVPGVHSGGARVRNKREGAQRDKRENTFELCSGGIRSYATCVALFAETVFEYDKMMQNSVVFLQNHSCKDMDPKRAKFDKQIRS